MREIRMLANLREVSAFKVLKYKQLKNLYNQLEVVVKIRGSKLFTQGDKVDYIYVVQKGQVRQSLKQLRSKPNFVETDTKKIFA